MRADTERERGDPKCKRDAPSASGSQKRVLSDVVRVSRLKAAACGLAQIPPRLLRPKCMDGAENEVRGKECS